MRTCFGRLPLQVDKCRNWRLHESAGSEIILDPLTALGSPENDKISFNQHQFFGNIKVASEITARPTRVQLQASKKQLWFLRLSTASLSLVLLGGMRLRVFYVLDNLSDNHWFSKACFFRATERLSFQLCQRRLGTGFRTKNAQTRLKGGENLTGLKRIVVWEMGL